MDKSFLMVFLKKNYIDPTGRQNFGDAPGQIPKLILTLCLKGENTITRVNNITQMNTITQAKLQHWLTP